MTLLHYDIITGSYKAVIRLPRTGDSQQEAKIYITIGEEPFPHSEVPLRNRLKVEVSAYVEYQEPLTVLPA